MLGRTRARLPAELDQPASTRDLAQRTRLSEPGVSQHLTALRAAGLCTPHRTGRFVLYARTEVAEALVRPHTETLVRPHAETLAKPRAETLAKPRAETLAKPRAEALVEGRAEAPVTPHAEAPARGHFEETPTPRSNSR